MKRVGAASLLLAAGVLVLHAQQTGKPTPVSAEEDDGVIFGTVIYEDGRPVHGATVYAAAMDRVGAGIIPNAKTNETGHFEIAHLLMGKYRVTGDKQDEDYPDMMNRFYSPDKFETVTLTSQHLTASVTCSAWTESGSSTRHRSRCTYERSYQPLRRVTTRKRTEQPRRWNRPS